jgi:hypothetical protein
MGHLRRAAVIAAALLAATPLARAAATDLGSVVPKSGAVAGWKMAGKPASYTRATLYDYIDGGADLYLSYGFVRAVVAEYSGPGGAKITVELYDMGSSYDAFGVFAREKTKETPSIGQGAAYAGGLLTFWKSSLFSRIFSERESPAMRAAVLKFGKLIANAVAKTGRKPPLLHLLPQTGLVAGSLRYLHTETTLNSALYLPGNPLKLDAKTTVVYGEYARKGGAPSKLVIVRYPTAQLAKTAFAAVAGFHGAPAGAGTKRSYVRSTERYQCVAGLLSAPYVVIVSNAPDEASARRLLEMARREIAG